MLSQPGHFLHPTPLLGLYTFMLHSILCTLCSFNFIEELFSRAWLQSSKSTAFLWSWSILNFCFFFETERAAVVLIPSGSRVKRTHLTLAEAVTCSFQKESPFGTVCLCFVGVGIVLFLYMHLCSLCQRSQTGVPYILFTLCSIIFSKRKEYWVCETDLYKKDLHNNLDFQLLNQKCQKAGSNGHPLVKVTLKDWMLAPPCSGCTQGPCSPVCYYPHWHVSLIYITNFVPIWLAAYFCSSWQVHRHRVWELAKSLRAGIFKHYYI